MVKVLLKHTIHRYVYGGKNYYPGDILEVPPQAVTSYMTIIHSPVSVSVGAPEVKLEKPEVHNSEASADAEVKVKRRRKPK